MKIGCEHFRQSTGQDGFTLAEVVISMGILALVVEGVLLGHVKFASKAEWSARSLAAQSFASQSAEQARSARWDLQQWPQGVGPGQSDELGLTNIVVTASLELPLAPEPMIATNYLNITQVSVNPPVRQIRSDCVWSFMRHGPYTNSVILLRTADQ